MKKLLLSILAAASLGASADVRLPEWQQSNYISNKVDQIVANLPEVVTVTNLAVVDVLYNGVDSAVTILDVYLNAQSGYEVPASATERAELLSNAVIRVSVPGLFGPIEAKVTSLETFHKRFLVPASETESPTAYVSLKLGPSETCGYGAAKVPVVLAAGEQRTVNLLTSPLEGETVEVCRIQPWNSTAAGAGASFIGTRITNSNGTNFHIGGYAPDGTYVDQSMTSVTIYDCPLDDNGDPETPIAKTIASGGSENAVPIENRLACLRNMRLADVSFVGTTATNANNVFVAYDPVWVKTTLEEVPISYFSDTNGTTVVSNRNVLCCVKWFCDTQADADYHLHPLFVRYERQEDSSYTETPLAVGYIARYALQNATIATANGNTSIGVSKSDGSNQVGNTRDGFLGRCKGNNKTTVIIADGSNTYTYAANSDSRLCSMVNLSEITFLQSMSYLYFGNNVQASMRGISEDAGTAYAQQANGVTDYIINQGIWTGGQDTTSAQKQIVFLGVEGGLWSAPGWMFPDWTAVWKRTTTTDATGAIATDTTDHFYLFAQDRADFTPLSSDEATMLSAGYRRVAFNPYQGGSGYRYRVGYDSGAIMRDAYLPASDAAQPNISIGGADYQWQGGFPGAIGAYSASSKYSLNAYVTYESAVYKCVEAITTAEAWDATKWELQASQTIERSNWYMVALGYSRISGLSLGSFYVSAYYGLGSSGGGNWRSRLSLQPLIPAANDE